jgi:hypothetical protein
MGQLYKDQTNKNANDFSLLWLLNLFLPGIGNIYAMGASVGRICCLVVSVFVLHVLHWWVFYPVLYLYLSVAGTGEVAKRNRAVAVGRLTREHMPHSEARGRSAGSFNEQTGGSLITDDFRRKLEEADRAIARQRQREENKVTKVPSDHSIDEQVKQWLGETAYSAEPEKTPSPAAGKGSGAKSKPAAPNAINNQPARIARDKNLTKQSSPKSQSAVDASQASVLPEPAAQTDVSNAGLLSLGETGYKPYELPTFNHANQPVSNYASDTPAPRSVAGVNLASGTTYGASDPAGSQEEHVCGRCGARRDHDFSFCLSCGHSYAFR